MNKEGHPVKVLADKVTLKGNLSIPKTAQKVVLFAHDSGSSRHSSRNRYVAQTLQGIGLTTLLFNLPTAEEKATDIQSGCLRFDIRLLANRLIGDTDWLKQNADTRGLNVGYFGASTGASAALVAAVEHPDIVSAIVSRGGS